MRKFLMLLIMLLALTACGLFAVRMLKDDDFLSNLGPSVSIVEDKNENAKKYISLLENYTVRDKSVHAENDNEEFEALLDEMFRYYISQDYLGMHYSVVDYRKFNIEKPEPTMGKLEYKFDEDNYNMEQDFLSRLQSFEFTELSEKQQYDYEAMEYSIYEDLLGSFFWKYNLVFSDSNCFPEDIYSNMNDFTFYDEESVDDYICLMEDYDRFLEDCIRYTDAQQKNHVYLLDGHIDYTVDAINGILVSREDNELITGFNSRIDALDFLTPEKKSEVKNKNREIVLNKVLPAYEKMLPELNKYYGKVKKVSNAALCKIDPDYARYLMIVSTSNTKSAETILSELVNTINYFEETVIPFLMDETEGAKLDAAELDPKLPFSMDAETALEFLRKNAYKYYPELGDAKYDAQFLNPDTAPDSVIAYYYPSPIDDTNQNVIRINPNSIGGGAPAYITLAHEGFPGHLFQHVYMSRQNQNKIHNVISFVGFVEGYAVYASRDAMLYSGIDDIDVADTLFYLDEYYFTVYSMVDILVNQMGYTYKQVEDFMYNNIYLNYFGDSLNEICDFLIETPCTYQRYGVGFSELFNYRMEAILKLGDEFDPVEFNTMLIKDGDTPFVILDKKFSDYLASHNVSAD